MYPHRIGLILGLFLLLAVTSVNGSRASVGYAQVTPVPDVVIVSPKPGEALQGVVSIMGRTSVSGFRSAEVLFGYVNDPSQTWFFITESTTPVEAGLLAEWDTSVLSDGNYTLRLVVNRADGSRVVVIVPNLRIRNYSPVETSTPTLLPTPTSSAIPAPNGGKIPTTTATPPASPIPPTITPLPSNPAILSQGDISTSLLRGAASAGIALISLTLYIFVRKLFHR